MESLSEEDLESRSWGPKVLFVQARGGPGTGGSADGLYVPNNNSKSGLTGGVDLKSLEHCPDFNERFTLLDGRTRAVSYPNKGFNCY